MTAIQIHKDDRDVRQRERSIKLRKSTEFNRRQSCKVRKKQSSGGVSVKQWRCYERVLPPQQSGHSVVCPSVKHGEMEGREG